MNMPHTDTSRATTPTRPLDHVRKLAARESTVGDGTATGRPRRAFTLIDVLVSIGLIGILIAQLIPAVQQCRHTASRRHCQHNLIQLGLALQQYEVAMRVFPAGTIDSTGPITTLPQGYHMSWITALLPYLDEPVIHRRLDASRGVYDNANWKVRRQHLEILQCPSQQTFGDYRSRSCYAACHHDLEAPIDTTNQGVFFLNRYLARRDLVDGAAQTIFVGEKIGTRLDLGWMSGTRATLRNTGLPMNQSSKPLQLLARIGDGRHDRQFAEEFPDAVDFQLDINPNAFAREMDGTVGPDLANDPSAGVALQSPHTLVGGFESEHGNGSQFLFGDGSVRFVSLSIDMQVYRHLGNRADGNLVPEDEDQ